VDPGNGRKAAAAATAD